LGVPLAKLLTDYNSTRFS